MTQPIRGSRGRIAFLWPADGRNDDEFWNYLPDGVALLTTRYPVHGGLDLEDVDADANPDAIRLAARLLRHIPVDVGAIGDCAGSAAAGPNGARAMARAASEVLDAPAFTMIQAIEEALRTLGAGRIAMVAPYPYEVTQCINIHLFVSGFKIVQIRSLDSDSEAEIGDLPPEHWAEEAERACRNDADAVLLAGGGIRIAPVVEELEASLGVPVVSGPAALIWTACRLMEVDPTGAGPGRLFRQP